MSDSLQPRSARRCVPLPRAALVGTQPPPSPPSPPRLYPYPFVELPAGTVCSPIIYQHFLAWLLDEKVRGLRGALVLRVREAVIVRAADADFARSPRAQVKKDGTGLAYGSISDYVRGLVVEASKLHKDTNGVFFSCLERGSSSWLRTMLHNALHVILKRCVSAGEPLSQQASALYRPHMIAVSRSLGHVGTTAACLRRLILNLSFQAAGRSGEAALLSWSTCEWNLELQALQFVWTQLKTGRQRTVLFVPGTDRNTDIFKNFGDSFIVRRRRTEPAPQAPTTQHTTHRQ